MVFKKQSVVRIIFLAELCLFVYGYGWGKQGIMRLYGRRKYNERLLQELTNEREAVEKLTARVLAWNNDYFYKERYAREHLHMAKKEEIIYLGS